MHAEIGCCESDGAADGDAGIRTVEKDDVEELNEAATVLGEIRNAPDKGVPEAIWKKAECVVVIPSLKKAGFIVRDDDPSEMTDFEKNTTLIGTAEYANFRRFQVRAEEQIQVPAKPEQ